MLNLLNPCSHQRNHLGHHFLAAYGDVGGILVNHGAWKCRQTMALSTGKGPMKMRASLKFIEILRHSFPKLQGTRIKMTSDLWDFCGISLLDQEKVALRFCASCSRHLFNKLELVQNPQHRLAYPVQLQTQPS